jgi:hypothetical protein
MGMPTWPSGACAKRNELIYYSFRESRANASIIPETAIYVLQLNFHCAKALMLIGASSLSIADLVTTLPFLLVS